LNESRPSSLQFQGRHGHGGAGRAARGSDRASSVAHSLRVSINIIMIPFSLTEASPWEAAAYRPVLPLDFAILLPWLSFSFILGEVSERMRFHNGCLLMPIFFGAALTISGIELSAMPHWLMNFAQLMFGLVLGARYERSFSSVIACLYRLLYSTPFSFSLPLSLPPRSSHGCSAYLSRR
jgi:uncharacterized membrane protein AbrB (regulator of aidB expression)